MIPRGFSHKGKRGRGNKGRWIEKGRKKRHENTERERMVHKRKQKNLVVQKKGIDEGVIKVKRFVFWKYAK